MIEGVLAHEVVECQVYLQIQSQQEKRVLDAESLDLVRLTVTKHIIIPYL